MDIVRHYKDGPLAGMTLYRDHTGALALSAGPEPHGVFLPEATAVAVKLADALEAHPEWAKAKKDAVASTAAALASIALAAHEGGMRTDAERSAIERAAKASLASDAELALKDAGAPAADQDAARQVVEKVLQAARA
jgi:hypothetical protein